MRRGAAVVVLVSFTGFVGFTIARAGDTPNRVVGTGQIRFNGLGPERWAQRYRRARADLRYVLDREQQTTARLRGLLTRRLDRVVWLVGSFQCIHEHEGAWDDPNPPYFGGLQMDLEFQRTYAPRLLERKGTADHWTPSEQIAVAMVAFVTRGFEPWPNTARACGLR